VEAAEAGEMAYDFRERREQEMRRDAYRQCDTQPKPDREHGEPDQIGHRADRHVGADMIRSYLGERCAGGEALPNRLVVHPGHA
jgi:hypothetical protein